MALAITEPYGGSDVANIKTSATKSADGSHYIVNGIKKWITNSTFCDYILTAVRTSDDGMFGISMLIIDAHLKGVFIKQMKC
jgi:alkylation response protein AidB-like acyl-CoA dehydrogenase